MDDRHASGFRSPAVPVSGTPQAAWAESPSWEVPYEPYGHPAHGPRAGHIGYDAMDPLFGAIPGPYDIGTPDGQPLAHDTWHYGNSGHVTALPPEPSAYGTEPNGQWYGGHWADRAGQDFSQASPDSADAFDPHNAYTPVDGHGVPRQEPLSPTPSHDEPTADQDRAEAESGPSIPSNRPTTRRAGGRGRRAPRRRSAFLTVVAPSVAFMGVAGIAAASVGFGGGGKAAQAAPDPAVEPSAGNNEFDTQLSTLSQDADDFAERASRAQERVDLEQQRHEEQKRREEEAARKKAEAARKEALRPKFVLPVAQKGVGELFGAVGSMWSSRHTGLDFPVPMYTPVMAVTDGTVVAKWNSSYGNIVEVTAPDGTQTWYAHLASARIRSGYVKAGTVIGYAGSSGNSSGPHLHLEVHPGSGAAVDPLAWLRSHGLEPT